MRVCNLSSGSDGNLTYIECENAKILVDIGLSCREVEMRLRFLNVEPSDIDAILITHEHSDHIKGLEVFASRYKTMVYVHERGYIPLLNKLKRNVNIKTFDDLDFFIGSAKISTVPLPHDVERCTGYSIQENEKKISIITDLGHTTPEIIKNISGSSLVFIEANHDIETLLANPNYPAVLKQRILSKKGHLSNKDSASAILELVKTGTRQIVLSHLSRENNSPNLAFTYISDWLEQNGVIQGQNVKIDVADIVPKAIFRL